MAETQNNTPLEADEQKTLVEYLELRSLKFTAIPNSTYTTSWAQKRKNKAMGLRPGLPDMLIIVKNKLLFAELKRKTGGKVSPQQKQWIEELNKVEGVLATVCKGADEAIEIIKRLLNES